MTAIATNPEAAQSWLDSLPRFGGTTKPEGKESLPLDPDARKATKVERRRMVELEKTSKAAQQIAALPGPGEAVHCRMSGDWNGFDLIPALLELLSPATATTVYIATLSFNRRVGERLLAEMDTGKIGRVVFLSSEMLEGKEKFVVDWMKDELAQRGSVLRVARNHCKLVLIEATDARRIVMEGSQNLRTCSCYEQFTLFDSAELFEWHKTFIERIAT